METIEYRAVAAGHSVDTERWLEEFDTGFAVIAGRFGRVEPRRQARAFLLGLLSDVDTVPAAWATADEFYGGDRHLRRDLQARSVGYVLAVAKSHRVTTRAIDGPVRADRLVATLPSRAWNRISAGAGSKGERDYDWAWIDILVPADEISGGTGGCHSPLVRRRIGDGELAFYRCWSPQPVPLHVLVRVAGTRWSVETCFQTGKRIGLDEPQVRRWDSWHRHVTLVMLAHAILTVIAAQELDRHTETDQALIPLTFNEIQRLFVRLITATIHTIDHWLHWSTWRRRHQANAKTSHYRRRRHLIHQPAST